MLVAKVYYYSLKSETICPVLPVFVPVSVLPVVRYLFLPTPSSGVFQCAINVLIRFPSIFLYSTVATNFCIYHNCVPDC